MAVTFMSYETFTAPAGTATVPFYCEAVVALVKGTTSPVILNGIDMVVRASMEETEGVPAVSIQTMTVPLTQPQPYGFSGTSITFIYIKEAVSVRMGVVQEYSDLGTETQALPTSTNDMVFGIIVANNDAGQAEIKGDGTAFTAVVDEATCRMGYIEPGDSSLSVVGTAPTTVSGYWYQPPPVFHPAELIEEGYWTYSSVYHPAGWYLDPLFGQPGHPAEYIYLNVFYTTEKTWVEPEYSDSYWTYPTQVWVSTDELGKLSLLAISIADVMLYSTYVSRPRHL